MTQISPPTKAHSILIINPNSTESMTEALRAPVERLKFENVEFTYFTAPSGPSSINNEEDAALSAEHCLPALLPLLSSHDAFLVCCYSQHPLVPALRAALSRQSSSQRPVTGIFEASVASSLQISGPDAAFGIVSTGKQWSDILDAAVAEFLGTSGSPRYAGTETTGLNATELHEVPHAMVTRRMKEATARLLRREPLGARVVCLGCAGMVGLDVTVREACGEVLGKEEGAKVRVVDGVQSGVAFLVGALRAGV